MSVLPHVVFGAAVGSFIPNPILSATAGFFSHFVLDTIPHWDPYLIKISKSRKISYLGLFLIDLGLSVTFLWMVKDYPNIFWAGLIGALVDLENFYKFIPWHIRGSKFHQTTNWKIGLFNQAWVVGLSVIYLVYFLHA